MIRNYLVSILNKFETISKPNLICFTNATLYVSFLFLYWVPPQNNDNFSPDILTRNFFPEWINSSKMSVSFFLKKRVGILMNDDFSRSSLAAMIRWNFVSLSSSRIMRPKWIIVSNCQITFNLNTVLIVVLIIWDQSRVISLNLKKPLNTMKPFFNVESLEHHFRISSKRYCKSFFTEIIKLSKKNFDVYRIQTFLKWLRVGWPTMAERTQVCSTKL